MLPQIIPLFPDRVVKFIDLFAGGCNVGINVNAETIYCNDIIPQLISLMKYLKQSTYEDVFENISTIIEKYELSRSDIYGYAHYNTDSNKGVYSFNKEKFERMRDDYNNGINDDIMFYCLVIYSFNNSIRFNDQGEYNQSCNKRDFNKSLQKNINSFVNELKNKNINFTCKDFRQIQVEKLDHNDFVYADPPYLITTANYNEREGWTENDEKELLSLLDNLNNNNVKFALSNVFSNKGINNEILINWAKKYNVHYLDHTYGNCNYHKKDKSLDNTIEVLITNYT